MSGTASSLSGRVVYRPWSARRSLRTSGTSPDIGPRTLRRPGGPAYDRSAHEQVRACPAGRAARARARARARPRRAALRRPASRGSPGHRGCRGDGEVAVARGGTRTGVGRRPPRPPRACDGARAGVPVRGRAPAVRAPIAGGRQRRARPLAGRSGGAGSGRTHGRADALGGTGARSRSSSNPKPTRTASRLRAGGSRRSGPSFRRSISATWCRSRRPASSNWPTTTVTATVMLMYPPKGSQRWRQPAKVTRPARSPAGNADLSVRPQLLSLPRRNDHVHHAYPHITTLAGLVMY